MHLHEFADCLGKAARQVAGQRDALCKLDTYIGDGDHGVSAERGFLAAAAAAEQPAGTLESLFRAVGAAMSRSMGGAIGPIYGAFWSGAAAACTGLEEVTSQALASAFKAGVDKMVRVGKASEGEKTILDAMAPCARAMLGAAGAEVSLALALAAGSAAATHGMQRTQKMIARKGRARFLGEKSVGFIDPGAASFAMFIAALAHEIDLKGENKTS